MQYRFNEITANSVDRSWAGSPEDIAVVREFATLSRELGRITDWTSAVWLGSVLQERARDLRGAERDVTAVRANQDLARRHVAALLPKARVTGRFQSLPARLASLRYRLGDGAAAVFDAVEWAKGRALSDAAGEEAVPHFERLRAGLMREGLHYLTFLLDEHECFAVLMTRDGGAEAVRVPVGQVGIEGLATPERISPAGRGAVSENALARKIGDWTQRMAALSGVVDAAFEQGRIAKGDTLLVSPHGILHLFPLHALRLPACGGRAIGEVTATVRVHGAGWVMRRMAAGPAGRPVGAMALWAPTEKDLGDGAFAAAFERCREILKARLGAEPTLLEAERATAGSALQMFGPERVLHFSCHGDTIADGPGDERSFLLLAHGGRLAERAPSPGRAPEGALTAAAVLAWAGEDGRTLRGTHVTLQACVSGHASANPQGDAVGLEWAFLMAEAASTLGSHWHVDREDAAMFVEAFYDAWLGGMSRATAWAAAGKALRKARGGPAWEAFSLTGEWR